MWPNPQFPADLVTFTEEILMENSIFCAVQFFKWGTFINHIWGRWIKFFIGETFSHGWISKYVTVIVWTIASDVHKSKCIMCIANSHWKGTKVSLTIKIKSPNIYKLLYSRLFAISSTCRKSWVIWCFGRPKLSFIKTTW